MPALDDDTTLTAVLRNAPEPRVVLGNTFVGREDTGGPLAQFLRDRRGRALDLYLLLRALSGAGGASIALPGVVWARALGVDDLSSPEVTVSRTWSWLERAHFVQSERRGRLRSLSPLSEDGSGSPFSDPRTDGNGWFSFPFAYFLGNFHNRVSLAGKCVLLATLANKGEFQFVSGPPPLWYGLSRESVKRGIRVLLTLGLLVGETRRVPDLLTSAGFRLERRYALTPTLRRRDVAAPRP